MSTKFLLLALTSIMISLEAQFEVDAQKISDRELHVTIKPNLKAEQALYRESIDFSVADPGIEITEWHTNEPPVIQFDKTFNANKHIYTHKAHFIVMLEKNTNKPINEVKLHMRYMLTDDKKPTIKLFTIQFDKSQETTEKVAELALQESTKIQQPLCKKASNDYSSVFTYWMSIISTKVTESLKNWKKTISLLVEKTDSLFIRGIFVFLLGLLMSLTPCIYPMIPITVGILQTSTGSTLWKNFLLALSYTIGIATTFATLGLLAATGSAQFGHLMGSPLFIIILASILTYLAFSMLGLYEMYIPKFMQPKNHNVQSGSFISAFIFGALSGSVASPCLSPGLVLLLSIVATLGNKLLGFILLFLFGLGLGLPLLIIGTFSNSLNLLPRAGMWMIEVKKVFGFMLMSMVFYYLNTLMPWSLLLWTIALFLLAMGIYYGISVSSYETKFIKRYKYSVSFILLVLGLLTFVQAFKAHYNPIPDDIPEFWLNSFQEAQQKALQEQKLLLVDFGASWCSSCMIIKRNLLHSPLVTEKLTSIVTVYIDCTDPVAEPCHSLQKKFSILGFPTILLVDPTTDKILKKWGSELLDVTPEEFVQEVHSYRS